MAPGAAQRPMDSPATSSLKKRMVSDETQRPMDSPATSSLKIDFLAGISQSPAAAATARSGAAAAAPLPFPVGHTEYSWSAGALTSGGAPPPGHTTYSWERAAAAASREETPAARAPTFTKPDDDGRATVDNDPE